MGKKLFFAFLALIVASTAFVIIYVQSSQFARFLRSRFVSQIERELGIDVDFDRVKIKALPPGISLINPKIKKIHKKNILQIPTDTLFSADELGLTFRTLQTFGKKLVVNKIYLYGLKLKLTTHRGKSNDTLSKEFVSYLSKPIRFQLTSGMELDIKQLELRDSSIDLLITDGVHNNTLFIEKIKFFALRPEKKIYTSVIDLENISWKFTKNSEFVNSLRGNFEINEKVIRLLSFDLTKEEMNFHLGGVLEGDVGIPEKLKSQLRIIGRSSVNGIAKWIPEISNTKGIWGVEAVIEGTLLDPIIRGRVQADEFSYSNWGLEKIACDFEYYRNNIKLNEFSLQKNNGSVLIKDFNFSIKDRNLTKNFLIKLSNVNLHDFSGDLKKDLNNLELIADGEVIVDLKINSNAKKRPAIDSLKFDTNLMIKSLELNNQVFGKIRKKKIILSPSDFKVIGKFSWQDNRFNIDKSELDFTGEKIEVSGFVDSKQGWNLKGGANNFNLGKNIKSIAENNIYGLGKILFSVKGNIDNLYLNFDSELKDVSYVNLNLGNVKGSITLDDHESKLILSGIKGHKNSGTYFVDGLIDVSGDDGINIRSKFVDVSPDDLFNIFQKQLEKINWIPHGMTGLVSGSVFLGGKFTDPEKTFDVKGKIEAKKIIYQGEIFSDSEVDISLKNGVYAAENIKIKKYNAIAFGNISYSTNNYLQYNYFIERGKLRDIDLIAKSGIPLNGIFISSGNGRGPTDKLISKAELKIDNIHMGAINLPPIYVRLSSDADFINFYSFFGNPDSRINLKLGRIDKKSSDLEIISGSVNYSFLFCILNSQFCNEKTANFFINGKLQSSWKGSDWYKMNGNILLDRISLDSTEYNLSSAKAGEFSIQNGVYRAPVYNLSGTDSNFDMSIEGSIATSQFHTKINGTIGLQILSILAPFLKKSSGIAIANIDYSSKGNLVDLGGKVEIKNSELSLYGIAPNIESLDGLLLLNKNRLRIDHLEGILGQGKVIFDGHVDLGSNYFPLMNLGATLQDNKIKFDPLNFAEIDRGKLSFTGGAPPYSLEGKIKFKKALMKKNFEINKSSNLKASKYMPDDIFNKINVYKLKIEAFADKGIFVQNDLLDAEFKGKMFLLNDFNRPQFLGEAELIKGKLLFRSIPFDLEYSVIKQENSEELQPKFSIGGVAQVNSYKINLFANGTANDPRITLNASPPLPQEDILSLLAFGYIERTDSQIRSDDKSAVTYTEVGSILLDQLRINKDLKSKGLNVRVVPTVVQKEANIIRPRSVPETALTKVLVGTQVVKNVDASLGTSVGSSQSQQFDVNIEYHLNDKISIQSVYEQEPGVDPGETKTSFGGDLKFKWGFK